MAHEPSSAAATDTQSGTVQPLTRRVQRLYVRIWLAVWLTVVVLIMLFAWAWRMAADPPLHQVTVRSANGEVIGNGVRRPRSASRANNDSDAEDMVQEPEFLVFMHDGQTLGIHLQRTPRSFWNRASLSFFWTLGLVGVAVALATYPIIRKLTRRLEALQRGVEQWGAGNLAARVPVQGSDEVAFLAQRFNISAQRIETLMHSHKSLLANASHELRSPLTRIRMGLELMEHAQASKGEVAPSAFASFKQEISRNIAELDQLIDEILLASRLDAQDVDMGTIESIDLTGLAAEECARIDALLDNGNSTHAVEVQGIAKLLRRAIRNLLENARRYSAGDIEVLVQQEGQRAIVRVCDHGPGVPATQRERIFEPFYRMPGASERDGGVGLGLALVRSIAQRHGGTVRCEDRPDGHGACFILDLPLQPGHGPSAAH